MDLRDAQSSGGEHAGDEEKAQTPEEEPDRVPQSAVHDAVSDTKGQHTNEKEQQKTEEKKDEGKEPKAHAGASGEGTDNTSAGSGGRGGYNLRQFADEPPLIVSPSLARRADLEILFAYRLSLTYSAPSESLSLNALAPSPAAS